MFELMKVEQIIVGHFLKNNFKAKTLRFYMLYRILCCKTSFEKLRAIDSSFFIFKLFNIVSLLWLQEILVFLIYDFFLLNLYMS